MEKYRLGEESRPFSVMDNGQRRTVMLRQVITTRAFADLLPGTAGGWIEDDALLSQQGHCWLYHHNSLLWGGARITDHAEVRGECQLSAGACIAGHAQIETSLLAGPVYISDYARLAHSQASGLCHIGGAAQLSACRISGADLAAGNRPALRIDGEARLYDCRITHQATISEQAVLHFALVSHRASVYGQAQVEGNETNHIWICDCAQVYDQARLIAGEGEDEAPVLRYGARVYGQAEVRGNCLLRQRVQVGGQARLQGGPLILDENVQIDGKACLQGNLLIEDRVVVRGAATLRASPDDSLHLRGPRVIEGDAFITQTPFYGLYG